MLQKLWKNKRTVAGLLVWVLVLALIRAFERQLFYDPFLDFFKGAFQNAALPPYNTVQLVLSLSLRYGLNTAVSLGIIYVCFKDRQLIKLSAVLYLFFFVVLLVVFVILINTDHPDYMILFYVRRFLIQPLFLLLFLPAFYYQQQKS